VRIITPSLLKLSPLMRCLMSEVVTEFRNIFFHRITSKSKSINQMLVWQQWRSQNEAKEVMFPRNELVQICIGAFINFPAVKKTSVTDDVTYRPLPNKILGCATVWQITSVLSLAMFHLWKKNVHNDRNLHKVKWSS